MTRNATVDILHVLNLDAVGGVEHLFNIGLSSKLKWPSHNDHALVSGGQVHSQFASNLQANLLSIRYQKSWHGIKIPKRPEFLRRRWMDRAVRGVNPDLGVLWNRFGQTQTIQALRKIGATIAYYEHGAAWLAPSSSESAEFARSVDFVICNSFAAKRVYELRWEYQGTIMVVLNCLRPDLLPKYPTPKTLPHNRPVRLGIAARFVPLKGIGVALHAFRHLLSSGYKVELHIAGTGPLEGELLSMAKDLEISAGVIFRGCVDNMANFYSDIDLLLVPSVREPFGMVIVEAAAHGCPAVATNVDGIPEALEVNQTGVCVHPELSLDHCAIFGGQPKDFPEVVYNPQHDRLEAPKFVDPTHFAEAIAGLLDSPAQFKVFSASAIEHGRDKFNAEIYARRLRQCFAEGCELFSGPPLCP